MMAANISTQPAISRAESACPKITQPAISEITDSSLPYSVRAKCDENLVALNDALRRQQQVQAQVEPQKDGTCHLSLLLADESGPLLKLSVLLPSPQEGAKAAERFRQSPDQLYHQIAALLCQDAAHEEEP